MPKGSIVAAASASSQADLRTLPKERPRRKAGSLRLLRSTALLSIADCCLDQGCCGSLPLLKVSSGCQVAQKCSLVKVSKGCGPRGVSSPGGVSDWIFWLPSLKCVQCGSWSRVGLKLTKISLPLLFVSPVFTKFAQ